MNILLLFTSIVFADCYKNVNEGRGLASFIEVNEELPSGRLKAYKFKERENEIYLVQESAYKDEFGNSVYDYKGSVMIESSDLSNNYYKINCPN